MISFEIDRLIERPRDEVFARLAAIDRYGDWLPRSRIFRGTETTAAAYPLGVGTRFEDQTPAGTFDGEVVVFRPPERIAFRQVLMWMGGKVFESRPAYVLESTHAGTNLRHLAEGQLFGVYRVFEPYIRRLAIEERTRTVDALERSFDANRDI